MPHRRARRLPDLTMTVSTPTPAAPAGVATISPVQDIVAELAAGRMVILVDEEDRENEGDLVLAADRHARGHQLHGPLRPRPDLPDADPRALRAPALPPMVARNGTRTAPPSPSPSKPPKA
jgi:3,4-dihydroxy 2-butanone 4-phosphate synthase/GTP cyclohydrolase II